MRPLFARIASSLLLLLALVGLSAAIIGALPDGAAARPLFQSPLSNTATPTATRTPITGTRTVTATNTPAQPITGTRIATPTAAPGQPITSTPSITGTRLAAPTLVATPAMTRTVGPASAPTAAEPKSGFLPAPTLSSPGVKPPVLLPGPGQPLVAPAAPVSTQEPSNGANTEGELTLAGLIDMAIMALGYLWLCCGVVLLIGATLIIVWLMRRRQQA